jgi:hypothetical protein
MNASDRADIYSLDPRPLAGDPAAFITEGEPPASSEPPKLILLDLLVEIVFKASFLIRFAPGVFLPTAVSLGS